MSYPEPLYAGDQDWSTCRFGRRITSRMFDTRPAGRRTTLRPGRPPAANSVSTAGRWPASPADRRRTSTGRSQSRSTCSRGRFGCTDGTRWIDGRPGDYAFVPEGGIHGFRNESGEPASMLILFAPGAPREEYFETLAQVAEGEVVLSDEEKAAFYLRHDNHWV